MSTYANQLIRDFANRWDNALPSSVFSGIIGHDSGYHRSIEDNPAGNYSIVRVDDKAPPGDWPRDQAAAVDMSMSLQDMITTYHRVYSVWSNPNDPRRKYINAVNVYDGIGDAERLDFVTGSRQYSSPDHKWHNHLEFRRRYINDPKAYDAAFSMVSGETLTQYLERTGQMPTPPPALPGTQPGTRTLRLVTPNMSGADVKFVQTFIGSRCGAPDGWFGPKTREGVMWYQRMRGIGVDGIVGPQTWSNMLGRTVRY